MNDMFMYVHVHDDDIIYATCDTVECMYCHCHTVLHAAQVPVMDMWLYGNVVVIFALWTVISQWPW